MSLALVQPCLPACERGAAERPPHFFCFLRKASGGVAVRAPLVGPPRGPIFSRVPCCASRGAAIGSASPRMERTASIRLIMTLRSVGENFRQELPGTLRPRRGEELLGRGFLHHPAGVDRKSVV